ncbi:V-type ATP synthase subunit I [Neptuniibacter sp. 2_MG-2023]|uniref:V-type ATP synthase subunit I n=1 Tax=Neptuniibacter sp. 2_MG-2023 TaxID=3062671 RepID=UPI0026E18AD9|nr:V-type ATP synthase subunit I [Neptuniibacter sp. 2_MG-2023]MDO6513772.1 V-type ATP synthase subunit I [Neptuniibacter sp. 2_MG-2023]
MSILALKKATLVGLTEDKAQVLDQLQSLGVMHIIPLQELSSSAPSRHTETNLLKVSPEQLYESLHYLLNCKQKRKQVVSERHFDLLSVVQGVEKNRRLRLDLVERYDFLQKRIKDLTPWGSFELPEENELYGQRFWFYLVPNFRMKELQDVELPWQVVHRDNRHSYIAVISEKEPGINVLPVVRTHTGAVPLVHLKRELEDIEIELETVEAEREGYTRWIYLLQRSIAGTDDAAQLAEVSNQTLDRDEIFAIQGWLADEHLAQLQLLAQEQCLALQVESPKEDELPPTLLDNPRVIAGGEEVVNFFQMPGYRSWDPSRVVFFSFVSFFALIMSDAGYSLLLAAILLFYWQRMGTTESGMRLRAMGCALAIAGFIWGVVVGSYFGAQAPFEWLQGLKMLDLNDFDSMMLLSITVGAIHLILGNLMMAWVRRKSLQAWAAIGWAISIAVALAGWIQGFTVLHWLFFAVGLMLVLCFSSARSGWSGMRLVDGLLALTGITKLFGDVLSYLRLFALGLASASLAMTFNKLAVDVAAALPAIGLLFKVLILLVGHLLNFLLTVISGVIHGLRLNLIEFYNWSLADEGYAFQPFAKQEVSPWIT